jgi:hypothetical protein
MERHILWSPWGEPGIEHLRLLQNDESMLADSIVLGVQNGMPFRLHYEITCDSHWNVKQLEVVHLNGNHKSIMLQADGKGHWTTPAGDPVHLLDGCIDVDISATPFTNTLPIRRLTLKPGQSAELLVVYILIPELELMTDRQRYTCLSVTNSGGLYRYESMNSDFSAELPVDSDGLVFDYPGLFKSIWRSKVNS